MSTVTFAQTVAFARQLADMNAAEFDYSLSVGGDAGREFGNAAYMLANQGHPESERSTVRQERSAALLARFDGEYQAMVAAAKRKSYTGWSDAARDRGNKIRYA